MCILYHLENQMYSIITIKITLQILVITTNFININYSNTQQIILQPLYYML